MDLADIQHVVKDPSRKNTYVFYAYRRLEEFEIRRLVASFLSGKKKIGRNRTYKILTTIGGRDPISENDFS